MNINLLAYAIYFTIMAFVIGRVGWLFYHHGQVYVDRLFEQDLYYGQWVNKLLLKAYYLFNLGYVALSIQSWTAVQSLAAVIEKVSFEVGLVILMLALLHYFNLMWLQLYSDWRLPQINASNQAIKSKTSNYGSE